MSVNGITSNVAAGSTYSASASKATKAAQPNASQAKTDAASDSGVVFEKATQAVNGDRTKEMYPANTEMIEKIKSAATDQVARLEGIVSKLITGQGKSFSIATGSNLKNFFENLEVDAATQAQAKQDISEDGYWGVKQTSERIFDFAKALSGGDPDKMEEMRSAFEKGFKMATKAWGDDLPDISQDTYAAVQSLFDDYAGQQKEQA